MSARWAEFQIERLDLEVPVPKGGWDGTLLAQFQGQCLNSRENFFMKMIIMRALALRQPLEGNAVVRGSSPSAAFTFEFSEFDALFRDDHRVAVRREQAQVDMIRALLSDTWAAFEHFAKCAPALRSGAPIPAVTGAKYGHDRLLRLLDGHLDADELWLIDAFEKVRNVMVHYGGYYTKHIQLNCRLFGRDLETAGNEGKPMAMDKLIALSLHTELHRAVARAATAAGLDTLPPVSWAE